MRSTMQDAPLSIASIVRYATTVHSESEVVTWTGTGSRRIDYGTLGRRAAQLANGLRALGVSSDQRVGTFMWNNSEHMEAYAAVPSMGAVLHTLNIRLFPEQLIYVANHAEDEVLVVDGTLVPLLAKLLPQMTTVKHVLVTGGGDHGAFENTTAQIHDYDEVLGAQSEEFDWDFDDERAAAAMCYTSGTTGNPKGVVYSHRSIYLHSLYGCSAEAFAIKQGDRILAVVPMFHAMAWGMPYAALMVGASMLMPDRFLQPEPLTAFMTAEKPTVAGAVPTVWSALLAHLDANPVDVTSLRDVFVGGSACPPAMMKGYEERHGVRLVQAWGMTETSPIGSVGRPPAGATPEEAWAKRIIQGRLPCGVEGRLVGDAGTALPHDGETVGELQVRGPWITGSYYMGAGDDGLVDPDRVRRRLAAHRRRRHSDARRVPDADRPVEGRHQVRRRVDLLRRPGERDHGPPRRRRGRRHRRPRRALGRAPARRDRPPRRRLGDVRGAPRVPRRQDRPLAAPRALDVHSRGPEDVRREVRQEGAPAGLRGRKARRHDVLTPSH